MARISDGEGTDPLSLDTMKVELPNGSSGDALVHVRLEQEGQSLLFDAGDTHQMAPRDVLRLSQLFVSHCHIDHFIGFDALVRARVCRADSFTVHGPPGFLDNVTGRLRGYTWNLTDGNNFVLHAREVLPDKVRRARFDSGEAFKRQDLDDVPRTGDVAYEDETLTARAVALDHHIVSLGWSVQGRSRVNVDAELLKARGFAPGPWLAEVKRVAESGEGRDVDIPLPDGSTCRAGVLADELVHVRAGDRVAYVTDTLHTDATRSDIIRLAHEADVFACEGAFLSSELDKAVRSRHMTAAQAGSLARDAGVKTLLLFHASPRYEDYTAHLAEAREAAGDDVQVVMIESREDRARQSGPAAR